ncbi:MAG: hypothetical protein HC799_14765 [Limnothrix sp. RL_2_0]|nr:hypothetical protein [Limnothrix sp. RL_2_0]
MNAANKEEVIRRVFRNTIRSKEGASPESIETAIKIIQKYSINHNFVDSLRAFRFMQNNVPRGGSVYYHYYHIIKTMMERGAAKFLKLTSQFQTTVSS